MTTRFEMSKPHEMVGDIAVAACRAAYEAGRHGDKLDNISFAGCEELKNFYIEIETSEDLE